MRWSDDENDGSEPMGMYGNDPVYSVAELMLIAGNNPDPDSEFGGEDEQHWCACAECSIMHTLVNAMCS